MALIDRVIERYSVQYIANLTNPDSAAATTADTTRRNLAAQDAEAEFEMFAGVSYDETNNIIVTLAVEGVIVLLKERKSARSEDAKSARTEWERKLNEFRLRLGSEAQFDPETTGVGIPSPEQRGNETVRPKFNDPKYDDYIPEDPRVGERTPDNPS